MMRLGYTILYVNDVRAAVAFYEKAFGLKPAFIHESGDFAQMDTGATALAFSSRALMATLGKKTAAPDVGAPCVEIALTTEDVSAALSRALAAGATPIQEVQRMPWGQTVAYVADPDGFWVELCTPMGA